MKKTFKHRLTTWLMTLGFATACSVMAVSTAHSQKYEKTNAYTVQKTQQSVTFTKEELNNCNYSYIVTSNTFTNYNNSYITTEQNSDSTLYTFNQYYDDDNNGYTIDYYNEDTDIHISLSELNKTKFAFDGDEEVWHSSITCYGACWVNSVEKSATISANQLNNNTYKYLANQLSELANDTQLQDNYIIYNNKIYLYNDLQTDNYIQYSAIDSQGYIKFLINNNKWQLLPYDEIQDDFVQQNFNNSITIYSTWIANNINAPFTDGGDIIDGITSGLGLISYIATAFLNGFTGLFYQNGALTNFAIYSLVMLGVAITFAIIKLVMNILRSNTGA